MVKVRFRCREMVKINFGIKMLFQGQQYMLTQEHIQFRQNQDVHA